MATLHAPLRPRNCAYGTVGGLVRNLETNMDRRVQRVIALMKHDPQQGLPLSKVAQSVNLSPSRFRYLFKAETGRSFAKFLKSIRLEKARELLETTFLSVKQIATTVGFNDVSHFVRDFKQAYGLSPTIHRRRKSSRSDRRHQV
jgi:AraC family transcriptional regulator, arabinose operon regulatory protein